MKQANIEDISNLFLNIIDEAGKEKRNEIILFILITIFERGLFNYESLKDYLDDTAIDDLRPLRDIIKKGRIEKSINKNIFIDKPDTIALLNQMDRDDYCQLLRLIIINPYYSKDSIKDFSSLIANLYEDTDIVHVLDFDGLFWDVLVEEKNTYWKIVIPPKMPRNQSIFLNWFYKLIIKALDIKHIDIVFTDSLNGNIDSIIFPAIIYDSGRVNKTDPNKQDYFQFQQEIFRFIEKSERAIIMVRSEVLDISRFVNFRERLVKTERIDQVSTSFWSRKKDKTTNPLATIELKPRMNKDFIKIENRESPNSYLNISIQDITEKDYKLKSLPYLEQGFVYNYNRRVLLDERFEIKLPPPMKRNNRDDEKEVYVISPVDLASYGFIDFTEIQLSKEIRSTAHRRIEGWDILLTFKGQKEIVGNVGLIPENFHHSIDTDVVTNQSVCIIRSKKMGDRETWRREVISLYTYLASNEGKEILIGLANNSKLSVLRKKDLEKLPIPLDDEKYIRQANNSFDLNVLYQNEINTLKKRQQRIKQFNSAEFLVLNRVSELLENEGLTMIQEQNNLFETAKIFGKESGFSDVFYSFTKENWWYDGKRIVLRVAIEPGVRAAESHIYWALCLYKDNHRINVSNSSYKDLRDEILKIIPGTDIENDANDERFLCSKYVESLYHRKFSFTNDRFHESITEDDFFDFIVKEVIVELNEIIRVVDCL